MVSWLKFFYCGKTYRNYQNWSLLKFGKRQYLPYYWSGGGVKCAVELLLNNNFIKKKNQKNEHILSWNNALFSRIFFFRLHLINKRCSFLIIVDYYKILAFNTGKEVLLIKLKSPIIYIIKQDIPSGRPNGWTEWADIFLDTHG